MRPAVHIVATGARTPLGLESPANAAAVRAGISALGQHPFMIDRVGDPMAGALDRQLDPALTGPKRLIALAETALREACAPLEPLRASRLRVSVNLALPEIRPGFTKNDLDGVQSGINRLEELPFQISEVNVIPQGHAAGLAALAIATDQMVQGAFEVCLVGGVDSYFHPDTMEWLDENLQLVGTEARSAFVPGEGAGFCLLMTEGALSRLGLGSLGCVRAVATGRETKLIKTREVCLGEGLTAVVQQVASNLVLPGEKINDVICDINSERYRCEEWAFVCLRLAHYFEDSTAYISPAANWGDLGAASAPLLTMLACRAALRRYANGPRTLLWASSEGGLRGAAVIAFGTPDKTNGRSASHG